MPIFRKLVLLFFISSCSSVFAGTVNDRSKAFPPEVFRSGTSHQFQQPGIDTIVIRFDFKQSALFHSYTLETLDSLINILLHDKAIKLSIDGYAHKDEGSDTICYFLSLNRALFIQTYILGRGIDSSRIITLNAYGRTRQKYAGKDKNGLLVNCRAELKVIYPPPPKKPEIKDRDSDGVADSDDKCPDEFGYKDNNGCPIKESVIVPFAIQESVLYPMTYHVLDSVVAVLKENGALKISIDGHAFVTEGAYSVCENLAFERADIVRQYLLSRQINVSRILRIKSYGTSRPVNPGKNPQQILENARAEIMFTSN